ncbi:MAG: YdeI/OmpD-associated family protein [Betaproteobacteria bacterium]|nr:YdeI/OmpD-associated family protein [Betaproteobacteria bacterium]
MFAKATFFRSPEELRKWFAKHHGSATELWVGFHKVGTGTASITWPESVDEALCVGWIDGVRKRIDDESYAIRFSPRRPGSTWSAVNVRRIEALQIEGRMHQSGLKAHGARREEKSGIYSYEQLHGELVEPYAAMLRRNKAAWQFFEAQPPWYRRKASWWVASAKKEQTRLRRLAKLAEESAHGRMI